MFYFSECASPLGSITLAAGPNDALVGAWFAGQKHFGANLLSIAERKDSLPIFTEAERWLARYFAGEAPQPRALPLAPRGSDFQQRVWQLLLQIPYGSTTSYGALAKALADEANHPMSARAVGQAVGHNPISVIIPCHRVLGANGRITGYAGGIDRKQFLLSLEAAAH